MDYTSIKKIVNERFSLGEEGFNIFSKLLEKEVSEYSFLGENGRSIYKIEKELYPFIDDGFKLLSHLSSFMETYAVSFDDYANNKIIIKGNSVKIFKVAVEFYTKNISDGCSRHGIPNEDASFKMCEKVSSCDSLNYLELYYVLKKFYKTSEFKEIREYFENNEKKGFENLTSYLLKKIFEKVGCYKINFTKDLYFVISKNFNDFFLCSNGEGWTSCLNPESSSGFWSSLPFLIADSNRSLCFISDLTEKEYLGVKSLRMFKRGWGELGNNNKINTGIFYPAKEYLNDTFFKKMGLSEKMGIITSSFVSKYPLDIFYNKYNVFDFLYQDDTCFSNDDEKPFLRRGGKNHTVLVKFKGRRDYHMCSYKTGLASLISENSEISKHPGLHFCEECYDVVDENTKIKYTLITGENKKTCKTCLDINVRNKQVVCEAYLDSITDYRSYHFGRIEEVNSIFCSSCLPCDYCGTHIAKAKRNKDGNIFCEKCSEKRERKNNGEMPSGLSLSDIVSSDQMGMFKKLKINPIRFQEEEPPLEEEREYDDFPDEADNEPI